MFTAYDDVPCKWSDSTCSDTIGLHERYPLSRREDITDAFMRGFECGHEITVNENVKLRELVHDLYSLYVNALNDCERMDEANIWEYSDDVEKDLVQSKTVFDDLRHRFDDVMRELGIEV